MRTIFGARIPLDLAVVGLDDLFLQA